MESAPQLHPGRTISNDQRSQKEKNGYRKGDKRHEGDCDQFDPP